jgi:hypothetical protein
LGWNILGRLNPSKSMTGLGDLVPAMSVDGLGGDASSRGSRAGLLTLCLLFDLCTPLTGTCFLFFFLLSWFSPDFRFRLPLAALLSEGFELGGRLMSSSSSSIALEGSLANSTIFRVRLYRRGGMTLQIKVSPEINGGKTGPITLKGSSLQLAKIRADRGSASQDAIEFNNLSENTTASRIHLARSRAPYSIHLYLESLEYKNTYLRY